MGHVDLQRSSALWPDGDAAHPTDIRDVRSLLEQCTARDVGWINLDRTDGDQLHSLADDLHLDDEALEDLLGPKERPKLDIGDDVAVLIARGVEFDAVTCRVHTHPVSAVVRSNVLVTIAEPGRILPEFNRRLAHRSGKVTVAELLYELVDKIVDRHAEVFDQVSDGVDQLSEVVFGDRPMTREQQLQAFNLRRSLTTLRRINLAMREVADTMSNAAQTSPDASSDWLTRQLDSATARQFADVADHVAHIAEGVDGLREVMSTLIETNLSLADVRLNTAMKKLASWAALIAVPTLITGFMGMNVPYPGYQTTGGFVGAVVLMVLAVGTLYLLFRRNDWL